MTVPSEMTNPSESPTSSFDPRVYWEQRLAKNDDLLGVGYTMLGRRFNQWQYRLRREIFLREISSLSPDWAYQKVLDIGSGTGFYIRLWKELGVRQLAGCDLTDVAVARLQNAFPECDFRRLDISTPGVLATEVYDVVSSFDVLFHIVSDQGFEHAIKNVYAALKPGGRFVFSENFVHGANKRAQHQVSRSLAEIESLVRTTGFIIERRVPMFVTMNSPIDSSSRLHMFLWKSLSHLLRRSEMFGWLAGASLFLVDRILTGILTESPTTELMVCKK